MSEPILTDLSKQLTEIKVQLEKVETRLNNIENQSTTLENTSLDSSFIDFSTGRLQVSNTTFFYFGTALFCAVIAFVVAKY